MRRMLVSRISRRVLAEHHIALSEMYESSPNSSSEEPHVGIIFTGLNVTKSIRRCVGLLTAGMEHCRYDQGARWPEVIVDGHLNTTFSYIREHFEFVYFLQIVAELPDVTIVFQIYRFRTIKECW